MNRLNNIICSEAFRDPAKYARYADDTEELYLPFAQAIDVKLAEQLSRATEKLRRELHTLSK